MSCETLNQQTIALNVSFGSLPEGFCPPSMQDLGAAIAARLIITPSQAFSSFVVGSLEPTSNVGPWLKDCLEWFVFDDTLGRYVPIKVSSISGNQPGMVVIWGGTVATIPSGYLFCDGSEYNRETYPELFAVIGTQYGSLSPFSFKVPDLRDSFVVGANQDDSGTAKTNVSDGVTLTKSRPYTSHIHSINAPVDYPQDGTNFSPAHILVSQTNAETTRALPPYVSMVYMIKT